jgi:hypothetical protein
MWIKLATFVGSMTALASVIAGAGQSDGVQRNAPASGTMVLWKNTDANLP